VVCHIHRGCRGCIDVDMVVMSCPIAGRHVRLILVSLCLLALRPLSIPDESVRGNTLHAVEENIPVGHHVVTAGDIIHKVARTECAS
jgi:hypothetical protein